MFSHETWRKWRKKHLSPIKQNGCPIFHKAARLLRRTGSPNPAGTVLHDKKGRQPSRTASLPKMPAIRQRSGRRPGEPGKGLILTEESHDLRQMRAAHETHEGRPQSRGHVLELEAVAFDIAL